MRVVYEINLEDMRSILAEKFEIDRSKIEFMGHGDLTFARIDVSDTETPSDLTKEQIKAILEKYPIKEYGKKRSCDYIPAPDPEPEIEEPADIAFTCPTEEDRYKQITDKLLEEYIKAGRTIPQICKAWQLEDSKYSARLYKRAEAFKSEDARRSNKKKAEDSEPGTE